MIDFIQIATTAPLPDLASKAGVSLKANGREFHGCCPFHNDKTPSFQIYPSNKGGWNFICQGCGEKGNALDFISEIYGVDAKEAARLITGDVELKRQELVEPLMPPKDPYAGWKIGRPPVRNKIEAGKKIGVINLKRNKRVTYEPVAVYPYTDKHDDLIGYVLRLEIEGKKLTPQVWWCVNENTGFEWWCTYSHPDPRPLYGLGKLYEHPDRQVLIVEGEKAADAAQRLLGDKLCVVTWMGGVNAVHKTYWKSLAGRSCILWPDNDDPGRLACFAVSEALRALGCKIKNIDVKPDDGEKGMDIADLEHMGVEFVTKFIKDRIVS